MNTNLLTQIAQFTPGPAPKTALSRLDAARERVRWHICGLFGVRADKVDDATVAAFLVKVGVKYIFPRMPGIGVTTEDELMRWARKVARS